ncbi:IS3 family transposase [Paenibacillus naphthalenovorans]|uniref:IS3 family transposase n=2 Tax=Paenibacillus TaxID=44249 RepID=UPI001C31E730
MKLWFITFVLSHSRHKFVHWQDRPFVTKDVIDAHELAFVYYGGMTREIVYDQDHLLLASENYGDLILTHEFASYVRQRGFHVHMCRKQDPESKGRVENVVKYVKQNFARHRMFVSVDKLNEECLSWLDRTGNALVHHTTKKIPAEVFAIEKQHLRPVLEKIKSPKMSITRTVRKDNTIWYEGNRYSVPLGTYDGTAKEVGVQACETRLRIYDWEQGWAVNRKRIQRLMRLMGIEVIYPGPNLSKRYHAQYIRPYLLRGLAIDRPNQVWGIDITYLRMGIGFMYLFVIIDWYSRKIIDYELSSTLEKAFVLTCLKRALGRCQPEIINSDQGSHFTNPDYLDLLVKHQVKVSMDGKGRARDNSRTERFFRSLKYEEIYLNEYEDPRALRKAITAYLRFYHTQRPHQSLGYAKPNEVYARAA